ncbi:Gfo/Idh/MocA family oxidoreductase [Saccharopolyspora sp. NPDC047091]|uniref:Gfo/Idh/MocA family protein n=1 Tax=Saccharopolyspora sp. NPDC047091 TaxID=3155924 RepID=UPI003400134B
MNDIGVAVIGAGMAGRAHAAGYRSATTIAGASRAGAGPRVRLVTIADLNPEFARGTANRFGYARADESWQAVAEADDVHAVSVVVANPLHREIVEALTAAGKHVLCEKPLAPTVADAEAMADAADRAGVLGRTGFTFRRSPAIAAVRELVESGRLGEVLHFSGRYWTDYGCDSDAPISWRYRGGPGSGALADIGSHLSDVAEFLCGPAVSVAGGTLRTWTADRPVPLGAVVGHAKAAVGADREPVGNEDYAAFTAEHASGASSSLAVSRVARGHPNSLRFEVFGTKGAATFDLRRPAEFGLMDSASGEGYRQVLLGPEHPYITGGLPMDFPSVGLGVNDAFVFQARAFLDEIAGVDDGLPACPDFAHGAHNLRVLRAATTSAADGGAAVRID